jgi:hypothetical protein
MIRNKKSSESGCDFGSEPLKRVDCSFPYGFFLNEHPGTEKPRGASSHRVVNRDAIQGEVHGALGLRGTWATARPNRGREHVENLYLSMVLRERMPESRGSEENSSNAFIFIRKQFCLPGRTKTLQEGRRGRGRGNPRTRYWYGKRLMIEDRPRAEIPAARDSCSKPGGEILGPKAAFRDASGPERGLDPSDARPDGGISQPPSLASTAYPESFKLSQLPPQRLIDLYNKRACTPLSKFF